MFCMDVLMRKPLYCNAASTAGTASSINNIFATVWQKA